MTGRTLLAALLIGAAPALADDSSIATSAPTALAAGANCINEFLEAGSSMASEPLLEIAAPANKQVRQSLAPSAGLQDFGPPARGGQEVVAAGNQAVNSSSPLAGEVRWGVNTNTEESRPLTPNPSPKGRGEEIVINPSADLGRHTVSHGSYLAGSNLYPVGRGKGATLKPDATSEQGVMTGAAVQLEDIDLSEVPLDKPTLDYLHENNVQIPQTEYDDEGNLVESGSILAPESAYTLTEVPAGADGAAPTGDNIITKFNYNSETGEFTPVYYQMNLKQTEYGDPQGDVTLTFGWQKTENEYGDEYNEFVQDPTSPIGQTITYKYNSSETTQPGGSYSAEYINKVQQIELTNPESSSSSHYQHIGGVTGVTNFENVLFKDNNTDVTLNVDGGGTSYKYSYVDVLGGALNNSDDIDTLSGAFINNSITSTINEVSNRDNGRVYTYGGALYNTGNIKNSYTDFIKNNAHYGGAIFNTGYIGDMTGDFIGNSTTNDGAAIYNQNIINNITSNFIGNITRNNGSAIYNTGKLGVITGDFIINSMNGSGIIYNNGSIKHITGDFLFNTGKSIYNTGSQTSHETYCETSGGAIYNNNEITEIKGNFVNNNLTAEIYGAYTGHATATGGAIYNNTHSNIGNITGNFIGNYTYATGFDSYKNGMIVLPFVESSGGAIYNAGNIENITGTFENNHVFAAGSSLNRYNVAYGGAIYNTGAITNLSGSFVNNASEMFGGAIANTGNINITNSSFVENSSKIVGGAVYNNGSINITNSLFIDNYSQIYGGAIYSTKDLNITSKDNGASIFSGNYTEANGIKKPNAIYLAGISSVTQPEVTEINTQTITTEYQLTTTITQNISLKADSNGVIQFDDIIDGDANAISTTTTTGDLQVSEWDLDDYGSTVEEFVESVKTIKPYWYDEDMTDNEILAEAYDRQMLVSTNERVETKNEITTAYSLNITGDETGKIILNNDVTAHTYDADGKETGLAPVNISLEKTNLYLGARDDIFDGNNLDLKSGFMSMVNNSAGISALNNLTVSGDVNFAADVDLANQEMDRFTAADYGEHTGNINVVGMNILNDAPVGRDTTEIFFAETGLMDNVVNGTGELPDSNYQVALTPIYKYNVGYETREDDGGYFIFTRGDKIPTTPGGSTGGGSTGNPSDAFNPAVLTTPVGNLAAGQAAMNEAFKYVFEHADAFTQLPAMERYAKINANKYALSTDFNENLPSYAEQLHNNAVWFRPYTTFETMNIKNGPKVDAITYGSLVGFDGDFKEMKNGWSRIFTGYAGYMGSSLNYSGVDTTMNGGLLGFTETFYKGNFWTAITASAGASVGESHTMYGKEDYTSLLAGVGSKTGYNFEFKDGKFIIQPIMFLSYTFVNTFDYKNAAGVSIESDPLHTIQLNPSVRFIANLKGGWQPYASVGMVWNLMNESKVTANNVKLPEMSVKPYVEYGVGVQRNWADKFTAFLQAMIRNGGRNGVALTGGFRFMLGSDDENNAKPKVKKEIKSL